MGIAEAGKTSFGFLMTPSREETISGVAPRLMGDIFTSSSSLLLLLLQKKSSQLELITFFTSKEYYHNNTNDAIVPT